MADLNVGRGRRSIGRREGDAHYATDIDERHERQTPLLEAECVETGMLKAPTGGHRFRMLELLVKKKRMAKRHALAQISEDRDSGVPREIMSQ